MIHWCSWIWSQARCSLYRRMQAEVRSGNVVLSSNFDSLVLRYPSTLDTSMELGEWRKMALTNVQLPYKRGLISEEKVTLPGVASESVADYIERRKFEKRAAWWGMDKALQMSEQDRSAQPALALPNWTPESGEARPSGLLVPI